MGLHTLDKVVLSVKNKPEQFLNGITSNTLDQPKNAFLNLHGKIIATFDQFKISDDEFFIVIEKPFLNGLLEHLDKFIRLSKAQVEPKDLSVYYDLQGTYPAGESDCVIPQSKGNLVISFDDIEAGVTEEEFLQFRLDHKIPVQGIDYRHELLLNVDEEQFVSYTKGCFLGQEPISKVHNRSKPTWKLAVCYEDECEPESKGKMTSKSKDPANGRVRGFIFIRNG